MVYPLGSCDAKGDIDLFSRIKECVSMLQAKMGRNYPVSVEEIAFQLDRKEDEIIHILTTRIDDATFNGMDLFVNFSG